MTDKVKVTDSHALLLSKREGMIFTTLKNVSSREILNISYNIVVINGTIVSIAETEVVPVLQPGEAIEISAKIILPSKGIFEFKETDIDDVQAEVTFNSSQRMTPDDYNALPDWSS